MTDAETIESQRLEIAELRRQLAEALKVIEEWRRGHRERPKRRSSRAEGAASGAKQPTRKRGRPEGHKGSNRPVPDRIDGEVVHPHPATCSCGGVVEPDPSVEAQSTIVQDIPEVKVTNVRHVAPVGRCRSCRKAVAARLPGSSAIGDAATKVQVGPNAQALFTTLRFDHRVPYRGVSEIARTWFGLSITPSGICQLLTRQAARTASAYDAIGAHIRTSPVVGADETSLRENGVSGYAWLVRTDSASLFRIERSRGAWVIDDMLGDGFQGVVCSDFYGAYTRRGDLPHGYCGAHMIREAKKIAEVSPTRETVRFSRRLGRLYRAGVAAQASGDARIRDLVRARFDRLAHARRFADHADLARLQSRIRNNFDGVTLFLDRPDVPFTNNATERDLRPIAVLRKITGGTRSNAGSRTTQHWMSITQTLHKNDLDLREWMRGAADAHLTGTPPPPTIRC